MDLEQSLRKAESAMQSAQQVKPEAKELEAIKLFCSTEVKRRTTVQTSGEATKALRATQKALRESLMKDLPTEAPRCYALSKDDHKRLEARAASEGLGGGMPPYLRLIQGNKDAGITPEVIQEAIESISEEDLKEAGSDSPEEALKKVVMQNIRRIIRSITESLKLVPSLPRGTNTYDIPEAPTKVADKMYALWAAEQGIKKALEERKAVASPPSGELDALKQRVEAFFIRTGLTAQRIVVEGKPYRLVRRVSVRKPRVGVGKVELFLNEIFSEPPFKNTTEFRPSELIRAIQVQLASIAPESKSSVSLCAVKVAEGEA